jgi:predicted dehydrogenase
VRVGLVGCGRIAERGYVPALAAAAETTLAAVADVDLDRCARIAPGVPRFSSAAELLDANSIDLLVVATPSDHHVRNAEVATLAGVRALVEKPPAPTGAAASALARLDPPPWIGFNRRFEPALRSIRADVLARVGSFELRLLLTIESRAWGAYSSNDGPLLDLGSHAVDLATWITGEAAERVRVRAEDGDAVTFELDLHGSTAEVTVSHDRRWRERVVVAESGRDVSAFEVGGTLGRVFARLGLSRAASLPELLCSQLQAVARALSGMPADPSLATAREGLHVMMVLDAVRHATSVPGEWVAVTSESVV